jgi:hypothetical protein
MSDSQRPESDPRQGVAAAEAISIVQRGNLKALEQTLRKQWRLGQNIVLCWSPDERGMLVILVPHYFLGNYCAQSAATGGANDNEVFIRELISGRRQKTRDELFAIAQRLDVSPTFIKLSSPLSEDHSVLGSVEQLIKRYGLSFVNSRAVILIDIAEFSLYTPFEQASQLNSLSYSLNSAYNKLLSRGIEINFARTTTGDGYYVWNRDIGPFASQDLFNFLLLVLADNAAARAASRGNTVPMIRTAFHIGSHYELYQAEGVNPTVFSYIVGDVTIELARMVDRAQPRQVLVGSFECDMPSRERSGVMLPVRVKTPGFVRSCNRDLNALVGINLAGKAVTGIDCRLTGEDPADTAVEPGRITITDKHGLNHYAYNLEVSIDTEGDRLALGLGEEEITHHGEAEAETGEHAPVTEQQLSRARAADAMFDDLAAILKRRNEQSAQRD